MKTLMLALAFVLIAFCLISCGDDDDDDNNDVDLDDDSVGESNDDADDDIDDDINDDLDDDADDDLDPPTTEGFEYIPTGSFHMGSPTSELGHRENEVQHQVTLTRHFEMMATEVTQGDFRDALGFNPSFFPLLSWDRQLPVERVSFYDALAYANLLSDDSGYQPCYELTDIVCTDGEAGDTFDHCKNNGGINSATLTLNTETVYDCEGFRLPTEAEWEYAARAGTTEATYGGDVQNPACFPVDENLDSIAWYCGNSDRSTQAGGQKQANAWDLYDMLGNVKEWTWDLYEHDNITQERNPVGAETGNYRVVRGGAARFHGAAHTRAAFRSAHSPEQRLMTLGFRLVRSLPADVPEIRKSSAPKALGAPIPSIAPAHRDWPDELPFDFTRTQEGEPLTPLEITDFTERITQFWIDSHWFHRYRWLSHGMKADNPEEWPEFKLFYQDSWGVKDGDVLEITVSGNSDNLMIRTGKIFNNAAALYLASGDETAKHLIEQYCYGVMALINGFVWSEDDPEPWIMPRTVFPQNYSYVEEGREVYCNYDPVKEEVRYDWNGWTIPNDGNPYYGDIWVRTHRSKDDVPHIYRMVPKMYRLIEQAPDAEVRQAAEDALHYLEQWTRDITDSGYYIRTKDHEGDTYIPMNDDFQMIVNDLASFVAYDPMVPDAECDAELATAFIAYGEALGNECGNGRSLIYDTLASAQNYFNDRNIIRIFHVDAVIFALMYGHDEMALELLEGLGERLDDVYANSRQDEKIGYDADTASFSLACATAGLPLTNSEARYIHQEYTTAVEHFETWPNWDPWDDSVPDGPVRIRPSDVMIPEEKAVVRITEMTYFIEYCQAPFLNPTGAQIVDCDVILDPSQWGVSEDR